MLSKNIVYSFLAIALLISCSQGHSEEDRTPPSITRPNATPVVAPVLSSLSLNARTQDGCVVSPSEDPFKCVAIRCQTMGAHYDAASHSCTCPDNATFTSWGKGFCGKLSKSNSCVNRFEGFTLAVQKSDAELKRCWDIGSTAQSGMLLIPSFKADSEDKARWADGHASVLRDYLRNLPILFTGYIEEWVIGGDYIQELSERWILALASSPRFPLAPIAEIETPGQLFYLSSPDELADALSKTNRPSGLGKAPDSNLLLKKVERDAKAVLESPFISGEHTFYTEDGCAGHCDLSQIHEISGEFASREVVFAGGRKVSDRIVLWESEKKALAQAIVFLLPSGQVSHVLTSESPKNGAFSERRVELWDRNFNPLLVKAIQQSPVQSEQKLRSAIDSLKKWNEGESRPKAVVCESGIDDKTITQLGAANFIRGPLTNGTNFLGWLPTDGTTAILTPVNASGVLSLNQLGLLTPLVSFQQHAQRVSQILMGTDQDVALIPIGANHCAEKTEEWLPFVKEMANANVINFSAVMDYTPEACKSSSMGQSIGSHQDLLFVVAAGNDGKHFGSELPNYCPQNLKSAENLLVVGSSTGNSPSQVSNRGDSYVDIFADGTHGDEGPQSYATSFAAPRVSRVAALLHHAFPGLTAGQIRLAILFSADIPQNAWGTLSPLPAKSGGILNEERAGRFGSAFALASNQTPEAILKSIYCWSGFNCQAASQRLALFKRNGIIK